MRWVPACRPSESTGLSAGSTCQPPRVTQGGARTLRRANNGYDRRGRGEARREGETCRVDLEVRESPARGVCEADDSPAGPDARDKRVRAQPCACELQERLRRRRRLPRSGGGRARSALACHQTQRLPFIGLSGCVSSGSVLGCHQARQIMQRIGAP